MPHEVIMPALGMAQDSGVIVRWLKSAGDPVKEGDALFEVETDKATMEVEAQGGGFLTDVAAAAGDDVPVGRVIARISDTAEDSGPPAADSAPAAETAEDGAGDALPDGQSVIMPALGMAQDSGLIVSWQKAPGDAVAADDVLFEVETDKSTMEVPAGHDGYLAATLAVAGEEVPVGESVAIIAAGKPDAPVARSRAEAPAAPAPAAAPPAAEAAPAPPAEKPAAPARAAPAETGGRVLASPKARRLALQEGLDLARLAEAGHPQPYHVRDLDTLRGMPAAQAAAAPGTAAAAQRLVAETAADGFADFAAWAAEGAGLADDMALLAGLGAASLRRSGAEGPLTVAVARFGTERRYADPDRPALGRAAHDPDAPAPDLVLRDLRQSAIASVAMGAEPAPVLTLTRAGDGLSITLECGPGQLAPGRAITLLTEFAGRMEQPLRHLL